MASLKPGDKVRLKKLNSWVTEHATMTVKDVGVFPALGNAYGALCEWINSQGQPLEKVYAVEDVIPIDFGAYC